MMLKRTAKSCGSDAPMPASSLREEARATVSNKPGHRGEREVSRKTIARGMPGETGVTVVTMLVCLFYFACEAAGALSARHSLRPLIFRRRDVPGKPRAKRAARSRSCVWRHFEERSDEAIQAFLWLHGLLRGACHRAALCADPLARNDVKTGSHITWCTSITTRSGCRAPTPMNRFSISQR